MSVFVFGDIKVKDPEKYKEYVRQVPPLVARHGGIYRVRGGEYSQIEGDWEPGRLIIIEFPDRAAAEAFYNDPDYQEVVKIRHSTAESNLILIEGI